MPEDEKREVSEEEIELRKRTRAGLRVERAINPPGGRETPTTAPRAGAEENNEK